MFQRFTFLAGLLWLGFLAPVNHGLAQQGGAPHTQSSVSDRDLQQLLQLSGIDIALREMPRYFKQGIDQAKTQGVNIAAEAAAALKAAADEVFATDALRLAAMGHMKATLNAKQLTDWLAFYNTPLGRKLTAADQRAYSPEFQRLLKERAPKIMETLSQDPGRMALLQSLLQATKAVEQSTEMIVQGQLALAWGLVTTGPPVPVKPSFEELKKVVNSQRFAIQALASQMTLAHAAATYQDFTLQELGQILQQANSPEGQALYVNFSRLFSKTLVSMSEKLGQVAGRRLEQGPRI
jgi:hypothetical protein